MTDHTNKASKRSEDRGGAGIKPRVILPFSARHAQVFMPGMQRKGVFSGSRLSKKDDSTMMMGYAIAYEYIPAKGKKRAQISIYLDAEVLDIS